ncbi:branched chain amino acid ABC transporter substrate-binding protein [Winogradskya consettensis]|uniref:Branched chain amino acid ABC transporter substrate-binding protein n=2 Tax=Winogradskya consettensis TaxID=113560 RepID=A0A919S9V9_9ACTN|nr:ABC transporter substrate-binding protein [Actinoplanes consettensis]GIM67617.1 branched chain amino acid ABC transporter substrate-binding protein [Actinoplanes consettensis]
MRLPRRMTAFAAAPALILTALAGCSSDSDASTRTKIVIGADLALGSAVDNAYADALQLRIEQINASNKLPDHELELRVMDNRSESKQSLSNISTLADDPGIAAIITGECDECVVGAAKTINDKRVPTIALAAADQVATPIESRRYLFKIGPNGSDSAAALTAELDRSGKKKVAIVYANNLYGNGVRSHLVSELQKKPQITVIAPAPVKPTATDVSQVIETVTADKPDALVVLTGSDQATAAVTAAKAAKFKGQVYFDAAAANDLFVPQEAAVATENTTMVFTQILAIDDVIATSPAKAARKQWFRDYTSRYGSYSGVASFGADAVDLIADAVVRAGGDRQRLRDVLETSQTDGLSGPLRLTPDNHSGLMPQALTLLVARSGRWRLLS